MFTAYWNSTIRESIRTQAEEDMVRDILSIKTNGELREAYDAFLDQCRRDPRFAASHAKAVISAALKYRSRELRDQTCQKIREAMARQAMAEQPPQPESCCPTEPAGGSFLVGLFSDIMSDHYAYSHIDPNSKELPSQQYLREKAVGSVLWDVLLGRR
jgi:NADH:ubiquinone oxidoreductase subunit D